MLGRLSAKPEDKARLKGVLKPEERLSSVGPVHAALERSSLVGPIKRNLEQSGLKMTLASFLLMTGCIGLAVYLLVMYFTRLPLIALAAAACFAFLPSWYVNRVKTKRMLKFEEHFPEAIDLIGRALRAGRALPTGLGMVADEMPAPVGTEFRILFDEQNFGLTLGDAMRNFARRIPVLDARFFV